MAYKTNIKKSDMYYDSERIREIRDEMHPNTIYPGRRNRHEGSAFAKYDGKIAHNKSSTAASTNTPAPKSNKSSKPIIVGTRKQKVATLTNEPKTYYDKDTFKKLSNESKSKK